MRRWLSLSALVLISFQSFAQDTTIVQRYELSLVRAGFAIGFNYDLLKPPTAVSYDYPRGYFGLDIPVKQTMNPLSVARNFTGALDTIFGDTTLFMNGDQFKPEASAKQNANTTIRVDIPMMGGVATFSNIQNFYFGYNTVLGNPGILMGKGTPADTLMFLIRGTVAVPLELNMNWETMTFGYAYRVNKNVSFALNLHRHIFTFNLGANVNIDLLGKIKMESASSPIAIDQPIEYSSEKLNGVVDGHYSVETWTPTLGLQLWRFTLISRFGINAKAHGGLYAKYAVPFFMNEENFQMPKDITTLVIDSDNRNKLLNSEVNEMTFKTDSASSFTWTMPQGHTICFDIVREKLNFSYTKFFGDIGMKMQGIRKISNGATNDTSDLGFDVGFSVDHMMMLSGKFNYTFFNLGVFAFDMRAGDRNHILGDAISKSGISWMMLGESMMMPVLNLGSCIGTKMQLQLELDVLPLPALKTGLIYNF